MTSNQPPAGYDPETWLVPGLDAQRSKVFMDRYALKHPDGTAAEFSLHEMWWRVAKGLAAVERPEVRDAVQEQFYDGLCDFKIVPAGRILSGAGTPFDVTYFNCFASETPVHLRDGVVPIGTLNGTHDVLSEGGVFRPAEFRSFGRQHLWSVRLENGATYRATIDHSWVVSKPSGGTERVTTHDLTGRRIPLNPRPRPLEDTDYHNGVRHGIVFGDGTRGANYCTVQLFGQKRALLDRFLPDQRAERTHQSYAYALRLPFSYKELPAPEASASYWRGFLVGLIATDGSIDRRGSTAIHNADAATLRAIADGAGKAGVISYSLKMTREFSPFNDSYAPVFALRLAKASLTAADFVRADQRDRFAASPQARMATMRVEAVYDTGLDEEVFCAIEPETHTITIGHGYLTGQCYVIPQPDDSRGGILDNIKVLTEIMARGGGVGVNLSTLRPEGAYIKSVNGHSSGPVNWAELYSIITGRVIQQGGTRRGALMIMLDDDHPDIETFIKAKRIDPLTNKPVALEYANVSVAVSDAFMQAVKDDADWQTQFPTRANVEIQPDTPITYHKVFKARDLWRMIAESAWASAEPGVVFMDRCQRDANTSYYERIRCVNPCGEQPLGDYAVCNLGHLNLAAFVDGPIGRGRLNLSKLAQATGVAVRMLDNVIDANNYFLPENEAAQKGTRRIGLGTMGLADALIHCGLRYGSAEATDWIDGVYATIRDHAYLASADLAREKGRAPQFDWAGVSRDGSFVANLPDVWLRDRIREYGLRNMVLLTQAPTGTTSLLAGVSSGIEPNFALKFQRKDRTGTHIMDAPLVEMWQAQQRAQLADAGPGAAGAALPALPDYFVTAGQLSPAEHVAVQAAVQRYVDASISKTVNGPQSDTVDDVLELYMRAWDTGCKGVTYYRHGSRDAVLTALDGSTGTDGGQNVESAGDDGQRGTGSVLPAAAGVGEAGRGGAGDAAVADAAVADAPPVRELPPTLVARPQVLRGYTRNIVAPEGTVHITINSDDQGPLEVFITVGKAGSDLMAMAEALGRMISLTLRLPSPFSRLERLSLLAEQLRGIGGSRTAGFGPKQVRSLSDAVGQALGQHAAELTIMSAIERLDALAAEAPPTAEGDGPTADQLIAAGTKPSGILCPECGGWLTLEEGCRKCYSCGHSEC